MTNLILSHFRRASFPALTRASFPALTWVVLLLLAPLVAAQSHAEGQKTRTLAEQNEAQPIRLEKRAKVTYDTYILGPGDEIQIELLDLPELSGNFSIGPDGTIYLPRLRALYIEGLTVEELRSFLKQEFSRFVREPQLYVRPLRYRPIRVYVGGEVKRLAFTLSLAQAI